MSEWTLPRWNNSIRGNLEMSSVWETLVAELVIKVFHEHLQSKTRNHPTVLRISRNHVDKVETLVSSIKSHKKADVSLSFIFQRESTKKKGIYSCEPDRMPTKEVQILRSVQSNRWVKQKDQSYNKITTIIASFLTHSRRHSKHRITSTRRTAHKHTVWRCPFSFVYLFFFLCCLVQLHP